MLFQKENKKIILGELHGADVNPDVIKYFIKLHKPRAIFFEWSTKWQDALDEQSIQKIKKLAVDLEDGRFIKKHLNLLEHIWSKKILTFCIDAGGDSWDSRDKGMSQSIEKNIEIHNLSEKPILIIVGNIHARKKSFFMNNQEYIPLAVKIKRQITSVVIRYGSGEIYNFGIMSIKDDKTLLKISKTKDKIIPSESKYFDFEFLVKETKAGKILR